MTATISNIGSRTAHGILPRLAAAARAARSLLAAIGSWWSDVVDSAQLGPGAGTTTGRHTGARI